MLDEFKRKYSNEDTAAVALPHLWQHFDPQGWSLWYAEYRYPAELSQTFMSCNLITGQPKAPPHPHVPPMSHCDPPMSPHPHPPSEDPP